MLIGSAIILCKLSVLQEIFTSEEVYLKKLRMLNEVCLLLTPFSLPGAVFLTLPPFPACMGCL